MRTSIKVIAATLGLVGIMGNALADDQSSQPRNRGLHLAIALQGDQALLDIRSASADSIELSIRSQMATSLPMVLSMVDSAAAQPVDTDTDLVVAATKY